MVSPGRMVNQGPTVALVHQEPLDHQVLMDNQVRMVSLGLMGTPDLQEPRALLEPQDSVDPQVPMVTRGSKDPKGLLVTLVHRDQLGRSVVKDREVNKVKLGFLAIREDQVPLE